MKRSNTLLTHVEELPAGVHFSTAQSMIAGGIAGCVEHSFMFPVDTVKTRMQAVLTTTPGTNAATVLNEMRVMVRGEGYLRLYRGLSAVLAGAIPSHALYFSTYEGIKNLFVNPNLRHHHHHGDDHEDYVAPNMLVTSFAGIMATGAHDAISTPIDVIKQRMQLYNYSHPITCFKQVLKNEGMRAFFISYPTTLLMNVPYTCAHFITYESVKHFLRDPKDSNTDIATWKHFSAGALAGAISAAISNPFDVVKTQLQTHGLEYNGIRDVLARMRREPGGLTRGLARGIVPRVLYYTPSAAITWTIYEYMKFLFQVTDKI
jgi:solute carrier family 25 iron transporter 28/37